MLGDPNPSLTPFNIKKTNPPNCHARVSCISSGFHAVDSQDLMLSLITFCFRELQWQEKKEIILLPEAINEITSLEYENPAVLRKFN